MKLPKSVSDTHRVRFTALAVAFTVLTAFVVPLIAANVATQAAAQQEAPTLFKF